MKRSYLLVYSDRFGSRDQVKAMLEAMPEVTHWRYDLPHSFYLVSEKSAKEIARRLRELQNKGMFIVTELSGNEFGWLTGPSWYLINHKQYKTKI